MPRSRPGRLRAQHATPRRPGRRRYARASRPHLTGPREHPVRIDGLSPRTALAVHRAETGTPPGETDLRPGDTGIALRCYRAFLAEPGRYLYPRRTPCGCEDCERAQNVAAARDVLSEVLPRLPPGARRELATLLAGLDEELRRRTLPDPFAHRQPWYRAGREWWHYRLYDESSHL